MSTYFFILSDNIHPFLRTVKLHLGGVGLYGSMKDYLILLRHLLQIRCKEKTILPHLLTPFYSIIFLGGKIPPNSIVSPKTVQEIFTPSLSPSGVASLDLYLSLIGIPAGNQWGTALAIRTEDYLDGCKKGSAYCKSFTLIYL